MRIKNRAVALASLLCLFISQNFGYTTVPGMLAQLIKEDPWKILEAHIITKPAHAVANSKEIRKHNQRTLVLFLLFIASWIPFTLPQETLPNQHINTIRIGLPFASLIAIIGSAIYGSLETEPLRVAAERRAFLDLLENWDLFENQLPLEVRDMFNAARNMRSSNPRALEDEIPRVIDALKKEIDKRKPKEIHHYHNTYIPAPQHYSSPPLERFPYNFSATLTV